MSDKITNDEVKNALAELKTAFEEHKKVNDKRFEALKVGGSTADFDEKLERIEEMMKKSERVQNKWAAQQEEAKAKHEAEVAAWHAQQREHERKLEARINRVALGLGGGSEPGSTGEEILKRKAYNNFLRRGAERLSIDEQKVLVESDDTTGGFLAPATLATDIIKAVVLFSPMRQLVNVVNIGTAELHQPKRTQTAAATRVSEVGTRSETQNPKWGMMKIGAPEMFAEARVSKQNLEDSAYDLEAILRDEFAEQFGVTEGAEVVNGDGIGKILGILQANAAGPSTPIAYTPSGSAATIAGASGAQADGLVDLFHAVKTQYAANGKWALNRQSLGKVRLLKDTTGQYLWQPGIAPGMVNTILGAPYVECPDMPDQGANTFPIAFGDWKRAFTLTDRIEIDIVRDPFSLASVGQVKFIGRRRVGGQVVLGEALRLLKCATS